MNQNSNNGTHWGGFRLTPEQLDTLKELGNIGSGHAIIALSKLLNNEIEVSLTSAEIIPFWKVPTLFKNPNLEVFGIYSEIPYMSDFSIIQIFSKESIVNLINLLNMNGKICLENIRSIKNLDHLSVSVVTEIGNILTGHYASALADILSIKLVPNVPIVALDTLNAMLNGIIAKYSQLSDYLVLINTKLTLPEIKLDCTMCFIPSIIILKNLFEILNIKYNMNL
ncbi:MAG: chemotaxis protein CheC [Candidatus Thorarchaeota archaeon]